MDPYWALAAERDIPVATHLGPGPPPGQGIRLICCPNFDETFGLPADFRPILEQHPNLRLVLLHAGPSPAGLDLEYNAEVFALASEFPNVYFDMSVLQSVVPEDLMREFLLEVRRHGIMDRLVLGTDGLPADPIIQTFMNMDILTDAEKRGILHDNAARLLKLDE
jgi:predicted TIM-barrel fold metal-dependent hydrolase